jgi:hypothetical protein
MKAGLPVPGGAECMQPLVAFCTFCRSNRMEPSVCAHCAAKISKKKKKKKDALCLPLRPPLATSPCVSHRMQRERDLTSALRPTQAASQGGREASWGIKAGRWGALFSSSQASFPPSSRDARRRRSCRFGHCCLRRSLCSCTHHRHQLGVCVQCARPERERCRGVLLISSLHGDY